jgi:hypothetical protein
VGLKGKKANNSLERQDHSENLGIDGKVTLKGIVWK